MVERVRLEKKNNRGGARPGAGRKKGSKPKKTLESIERMKAMGMEDLPHEFLARVAMGDVIKVRRHTGNGRYRTEYWSPTPDQQIEAAKACAGYFQPKLVSQRVSNDPDSPFMVQLDPKVLKGLPEQMLMALKSLIQIMSVGGVDELMKHTTIDHQVDENEYGKTMQ